MKASQNLSFNFIKEKETVTDKLSSNGFIQQSSAGVFHILPIGTIVIQKIEKIIREELNKINSVEVMMSVLQPKDLWTRSGRSHGYQDETMRLTDRTNKEFFLAPTAEEAAVEIIEKFVFSYKQLPMSIYQIGKKYRDDLRPRFGMIRCKEFIMKDAYSFDITKECAIKSLVNMYNTYIKIFSQMGLQVIPVKADTGLIGGDLSYELVVLAPFGENTLYYNREQYGTVESAQELENNSASFEQNVKFDKQGKCIELGHIYYLGQKYSQSMNSHFTNKNNEKHHYEMGCYGIGVSRLLGAIKAIKEYWPYNITPFHIYLVGDNNLQTNNLYRKLQEKYSVYFDDRDKSFSYKKQDAKQLGIAITIVSGKTLQFIYKQENWEIESQQLECYIEKYLNIWQNN